jgi:hypothetical protein
LGLCSLIEAESNRADQQQQSKRAGHPRNGKTQAVPLIVL